MKKIIGIIVFILVTGNLSSQDYTESENTVRKLISELVSVVENSPNSTLKKTLELPLEKFYSDELHFQIVEKVDGYNDSYLGHGMFSFFENPESPQIITIEDKLLRFYPENRSLIMAVIMHEFSHANNYYADPEHMRAIRDNKLEKYLYEMDAMFIEAQFIEAAESDEYTLSRFESFLLTSMIDDNLALASLITRKIDNKLVWSMIRIKDNYINEKLTFDLLISDLNLIGSSLLEDWNQEQRDSELSWAKLVHMIKMKTFQQFVGTIINGVITDQILQDFQQEIDDINSLIDSLFEEIDSQWSSTSDYRDQLTDYIMLDEN